MSKRRLSPCLDETAGPAVVPAAAAAVNAPRLAAAAAASPLVLALAQSLL